MLRVRRSSERGHFRHGWLDTFHTFSFGDYWDEDNIQFRALRVLNEDWVAPAQGFGSHPHRDMEILTWVLSGQLRHRDSLGHESLIRPGEIQRISAGTGIFHSETNPSAEEPVHLLQVWILPDRKGHQPSYDQKTVSDGDLHNQLALVASGRDRSRAIAINQDADLRIARLDPGVMVGHDFEGTRHGWVQVARGKVEIGDHVLEAGDGLAISGESHLDLTARTQSEVLLFDLP